MEAWDDMRENDPEASFSVIVVDSRPLNEGPSSFLSPHSHPEKESLTEQDSVYFKLSPTTEYHVHMSS